MRAYVQRSSTANSALPRSAKTNPCSERRCAATAKPGSVATSAVPTELVGGRPPLPTMARVFSCARGSNSAELVSTRLPLSEPIALSATVPIWYVPSGYVAAPYTRSGAPAAREGR